MKYRHEQKIQITYADLYILRQRMCAVAGQDAHAVNGRYFIRSLYFDTPEDKALREKLDGVNVREKFRIRCYNRNYDTIHLEKKSKWNGLGNKQSTGLSRTQTAAIIAGDTGWMKDSENGLIKELYQKILTEGLRPKTIVDYTREPFVYAPGNVRVTFDYDIRTALRCTDFLDPDCLTIPAGDTPILMEVKWDEFLPDIIRDALQLSGRRAAAFSKYAQCRIYG